MKITKLLPKSLAISYQEHDLQKTAAKLEYYKELVQILEERYHQGRNELERLRGYQ